jgi:hypothetical protein
MNATPKIRAALRSILLQPTNGAVGIGDELLDLCEVHELHFNWHSDSGHVRVCGEGGDILFDEPYRKSIFRAILARVAALCNERGPTAVSPYGGHAELPAQQTVGEVLRVTFVNTPDRQTLDLCWPHMTLRSSNGNAGRKGVSPPVS